MRGLTQYYHQIALIPETGSLLLRGLDKRAGGIHKLRIWRVQHVLVSLRDPVRPDDYRSSIHRFYRFHQVYSTRYQLLDYGWIVYERPQSLDWLLCVFRRLVGDLEGHVPHPNNSQRSQTRRSADDSSRFYLRLTGIHFGSRFSRGERFRRPFNFQQLCERPHYRMAELSVPFPTSEIFQIRFDRWTEMHVNPRQRGAPVTEYAVGTLQGNGNCCHALAEREEANSWLRLAQFPQFLSSAFREHAHDRPTFQYAKRCADGLPIRTAAPDRKGANT